MAVSITNTANPAGVSTVVNVATYSSVSIGAEATDRIIAVAVGVENSSSPSPSACTIDSGGGAVSMTAGTVGNFGNVYARIFYLNVPTGTTATIAVTYSSADPTNTQNHIAVYRVIGASTVLASEGGDGSTDMDSTDPLTTGSIIIPTDGGFLAVAAGASDGDAKTWSQGEDLDVDAGFFRFTTAFSTTPQATTITCTDGIDGNDGALSWVVFNQLNTSNFFQFI